MTDGSDQRAARILARTHLLRVDDDGRPHRPRNNPTPIVIFQAPCGGGKTTLLDSVTADLARIAPFARFDFAAPRNRKVTVDEALTVIAWELGRWCPVYGSLTFRRFAVGQLVKRLPLDMTKPYQKVRQGVETALASHQHLDTLRHVLQEATAEVLGQLPALAQIPGIPVRTLGKYTVQFAVDRLVARMTRLALSRCLRWYEAKGASGDGVDVLIDLNQWAAHPDAGNQARATELQMAAFFADVHDDFQRGRRSREWSFNGAIFLDNVDRAAGPRFLAELGRARVRHRGAQADKADPLTVIATSRSRVPANDAPVERVTLRALNATEVDTLASGRRLRTGDVRLLARRVHAFTGGHPESVTLLLQAATDYGTANVELNELLDWRNPSSAEAGKQPPTTADLLANRMLADVSDNDKDDLVTLSAARDRDQALLFAARTTLLNDRRRMRTATSEPDLWAADDAAAVVLRRLLSRRLAARDPEHDADWVTVHGALRRCCDAAATRDGGTQDDATKDIAGELYHDLAVGNLQVVVTALADQLPTTDTATWLALLKSVTSAPRRPDSTPPHDQVTKLGKTVTVPDDRFAPLAQLVAGLWIAADPTTPGNRFLLHDGIAADYRTLRNLATNPALLLAEAAHHNEMAGQWR